MNFDISTSSSSIELKAGSSHAQFTVTNLQEAGLIVRAKPVSLDGASDDWFTVEGDTERPLQAGGTTVFSVTVTVPEGTEPGMHKFRLDAVKAGDSDDNFRLGPEVSFEVAEAGPKRRVWPYVVAAVAGLLLLVGGIWVVVKLASSSSLELPDVVGAKLEEATTTMEDLGLTVELEEVVQGAPENEVLAQDPDTSAEVKEGDVVTLTFEAPHVEIPNLIGKRYDDAEMELSALGLIVTSREVRREDPSQAGRVTALVPAVGARVVKESPIAVFIEAPMRTMPELVGMPASEALAVLEEMSLHGILTVQTKDPSKGGQVVTQSIGAEQLVQEGANVKLTVEAGRIAAPNVVTLSMARAKERIREAGLKFAKGDPVANSTQSPGTVGRQAPGAETPLTEGALVTVFPVGKGIKVPSVVGRTRAAAEKALRDARLKPKARLTFDPAKDGLVTSQNLLAAFVLEGTEVTVFVGTKNRIRLGTTQIFQPIEVLKAGPAGLTIHKVNRSALNAASKMKRNDQR